MRSVVLLASLAAAAFGGSSAVLAQQVIAPYPDDPPYYEEYAPPGPTVYRYRSDAPAVLPVRPANCGEFRYWNGYRCVDARVAPPDLR